MSMRLKSIGVLSSVALLATVFGNDAHASTGDVQEWKFRVLLDDKEIGYHDYRISADGPRRRVETEASFDVKFLFFNAYRYRHRNVETWDADCLTGIEADTDANGKKLNVRGTARDERFVVEAGSGEKSLPECVMSFAYWNPAFLDAPRLLNAQTGEFESVDVVDAGTEALELDGTTLPARRYEIGVKGRTVTVWYGADDQRWLALESPARGGRVIRYEPVELPPATTRLSRNDREEVRSEG